MCGIAGIFDFDPHEPVDVRLLEAMNAAIVHRGPDEDGFYAEGGVGLANRRLSIIGLADGRQPIANEDRTVWTVFNGEIYNYPDLRAELEAAGHRFRTGTDTEVLVHAYEDDGDAFVRRLNGMFAIALWDVRRRRLLLYRDRLGEKPLYYVVGPRRLLFASEIKALLRAPETPRAICPAALADYLTFQYNARRETIFRDVRRLKPGTMLDVTAGGVVERTYWEVPTAVGPPWSEARWIEALRELLRDSVRRRLLSEVPLGAFLSGGIDSSTVVGLMASLTEQPVQTFSVGFRVPGTYDESEHAARVARHFRTRHRALTVDSVDVERLLLRTVHHLDEPVADYAAIPTYLLSQFARQHVKVVLTGEGADELFAGYDHYRFPSLLGRYGRVPLALRRLLAAAGERLAPAGVAKALRAATLDPAAGWVLVKAVFRRAELRSLLAPDLRAALDRDDPGAEAARLFQRARDRDPLDRYLLADIATWLPEDLLMKVDKMSMSMSLEARVPFLDHRIVELAASMPAALKWHGGGKYVLKRAVADLVPPEIVSRPKHGFRLPLDRWFREELRAFASDLLVGPRPRARQLFDPARVEALWGGFLAGNERWFMPVWVLLNFEVWCRVFLDGETPA
ncbi:MAG TPA: asparagine synthase (glutamine-hydrolyzing) [Candidatus Binatia bacterium]|nr:asparagine synthase (glutamine-hydrolyzing) [Candidatus Binatia bacterium]